MSLLTALGFGDPLARAPSLMAVAATNAACAASAAAASAAAAQAGILGGGVIPGGAGNSINTTGVARFGGWSGIPPDPPRRDPFEYACEVAAKQPADKHWRRFQHALFRVEDVIAMSGEGSGSICVLIRLCNATRNEVFTLPFDCQDPVQWFAEHVMGMEFPNAPHAT